MGHEGTLADPPSETSCPVCGAEHPVRFVIPPYPSDYPFLPDEGGYERHGESTVEPRPIAGARRKKMKWRS
jgi:hypothetical protein